MRQGTEEWKQARKKFIGASDAAVIMGVSPWRTPYQLWQEKMGFVESQSSSSAMQRGIEMEPIALEEYESLVGHLMMDAVVFNDDYPWMMASMDGIPIDGGDRKDVEIKVPGRDDHATALSGNVPFKYHPQLQHQMCVRGKDKMDYFSWNEESTAIIEVVRDQAYIDNMLDLQRKFYECMQTKTPPPLTERDYIDKSEDYDWAEMELQLLAAQMDRKAAESEEKRIKKLLEERAGGYNVKGRYTKFTRVVTIGRVNYDSIPELQGVDLNKFRGEPSVYWKVTENKK